MSRRSLALLLSATLALLASASADAASYEVKSCRDAPGATVSAFGEINTYPATITTRQECPPVPSDPFSGLLAAATLGTPNTPSGARGGWTLTAPSGTTLQQVTARRYLGKRDHDWDVGVRTAEGTVLDSCDFDPSVQLSCTVGSATPGAPENAATYANLNTQSLSFAVTCNAGPFTCANGVTQRQAWIAVYGATATINDPAPPTIAALSGSLLGPGAAAGWHRGSEQVTIPASDASGIKTLGLLIDGRQATSVAQPCDYTRMQPCPPSVSETFTVHLAGIGDGAHELRATASDAADQQQISPPTTLRVDQEPPTAPQGLTLHRNADGSHAARWQNPDQGTAAPITAAHHTVCRTSQPAQCRVGETLPGADVSQIPSIAVPADGTYEVRVWLQDEAGNSDPARAASVTIDTRTSSTPPPGKSPTGKALPGGTPTRSPKLRPKRATRRGRDLRISGTIAMSATGTISVTLAGTRTGRPLLTAETKVRRGRWTLRVRLTRTQQRNPPRYVILRYSGDRRYVRAKLQRKLIAQRGKKLAKPSAAMLQEFGFERATARRGR